MTSHRWSIFLLSAALCVVGSAQGVVAESYVVAGSYWEEFSSTEYVDASNTTALVDTGAGELRLQPFQFESIGGFDTPGETFAVRFSGDLLVVADRHSGLEIYDIVIPAASVMGLLSAKFYIHLHALSHCYHCDLHCLILRMLALAGGRNPADPYRAQPCEKT